MLELLFTNDWQHPSIDTIVKDNMDEDQINPTCEVWTGPWLRIYTADGDSSWVAWFPNKDDYNKHLDTCYEKFNESYNKDDAHAFSRKMINSLYKDMKEKNIQIKRGEIVSFSPDLGLHVNDGKWGFDT